MMLGGVGFQAGVDEAHAKQRAAGGGRCRRRPHATSSSSSRT